MPAPSSSATLKESLSHSELQSCSVQRGTQFLLPSGTEVWDEWYQPGTSPPAGRLRVGRTERDLRPLTTFPAGHSVCIADPLFIRWLAYFTGLVRPASFHLWVLVPAPESPPEPCVPVTLQCPESAGGGMGGMRSQMLVPWETGGTLSPAPHSEGGAEGAFISEEQKFCNQKKAGLF